MIRTVDLVIAGGGDAALTAAGDALRRGLRVLIVLDGEVDEARRVRRILGSRQLAVIAHSEIVCVDGVNAIEAVVIRNKRTRRLWAVNASSVVAPAQPA